MRTPIQVIRDFHACEHWKAHILMAVGAVAFVTYSVRWWLFVFAQILPPDAWGAEKVRIAVAMSGWHFTLTALAAALGGVTSFFHEVKIDPTKLRIPNALGHMFAAQSAGLAAYLWAIESAWSEPLAIFASLICGWSGNKFFQVVSDLFLSRIGVAPTGGDDRDRRL